MGATRALDFASKVQVPRRPETCGYTCFLGFSGKVAGG